MMPKITETIASPHQSSRNGYLPQLIVLHICDGYYDGTKSWFMNPTAQVSSHFIVANDGRICRCVDISRMAWCNGTNTFKNDNNYFGHSTVKLVRELGGNANAYSVSIECEGFWKETKGELTAVQSEAVAWLVGHIRDEVKRIFNHTIPPDREHLVGHYELSPLTRPNCPGQKFPWDALMAKLAGNPTEPEIWYRVRKSWGDASTQLGAFHNLEFAQAMADKNPGYSVYDSDGKPVYPPAGY